MPPLQTQTFKKGFGNIKSKLGKDKKLLLLRIFRNILQNSDLQNKNVLIDLYKNIEDNRQNLIEIICDLRIEHHFYFEIIEKIGKAIKDWEDIILEILEDKVRGFSEVSLF